MTCRKLPQPVLMKYDFAPARSLITRQLRTTVYKIRRMSGKESVGLSKDFKCTSIELQSFSILRRYDLVRHLHVVGNRMQILERIER